jgi:hypothetical protein
MKTRDDLGDLAAATGRSWAERKAERLSGEIAAHDWPEPWQSSWDEALPLRTEEVPERERAGLLAIATRAAADRWRELVVERRYEEDVEDEEVDEEIGAADLVRALRGDLPEGLTVAQAGERAVFRDREGFERTISSLAQAWRVVAEYEERRSLRT